jgi:acyl-CoA synthetase (AMP-forming)/AMP-acid ligase II
MRAIDLLDHGLKRAPEHGYIRDATKCYSHAEVLALSHRIANALQAAGVRRGSRVAFYSPNSAIAFVALIGVLRVGAVWQPVHLRNPLPENIDFLRENDCEFLFHDSKHGGDAAQIKAAVGSLKGARCLDQASEDGAAVEAWASAFPDSFPDDDHEAEDLAWIKATGGTTGRPKSVMICHRNVQALFATFRMCMPLPEGHVNLVVPPMTHGAGNIALSVLSDGGSLVTMERADPAAIVRAIADHRVTTMFLPPTVIYSMLALPGVREADYSSLRYFLYTGAPMSSDKLKEALDVFGRVMTQTWGQTEAPLICTYLGPEEHADIDGANAKILRSCGRASPLTRVEIMDETGRLLGPGEVGELVVRGDLVMKGYFERPEENEKASRFGWHHTGDVGYRDDEGLFFIVDRNKDMIISGGFNIYPSEIEQVLWRHPSVLDCAVIGVPDEKWGEAVKAVVELKPGLKVSEDELKEHCRSALASLKTPKTIEIWDTLPRSSLGKVLKREIREKFWQEQWRRV